MTTTQEATSLSPSFLARAEQLIVFYRTYGRLPIQCDAADPEEHSLGDFLRCHRSYIRRGYAPARIAWLDTHLPTWRSQSERSAQVRAQARTFDSRVRAVARFVAVNGRWPRTTPGQTQERVLGLFLVNQRQAKKGRGTTAWTTERERLLNEMLPGWDAARSQAPVALSHV